MDNVPVLVGDIATSEDSCVHAVVESRGFRSICDLGCGDGRNLIHLASVGAIDFGFGVDAELHDTFEIGNIKPLPAVRLKLAFHKGDWREAGQFVPPIPFGLCYSNNVLEHLPAEDADEFIAASIRIGNGLAFHILPIEKTHWDGKYHLTSWTIADYRALLERHGEILDFGHCGNGNMVGLVRRQ